MSGDPRPASSSVAELIGALDAYARTGAPVADQPAALRQLLARIALDHMFQFVAVLSPDGTLLEANAPAVDAGGLRREAAVGRPFWEARWWQLTPDTGERLRGAVRRAAAGDFVRYEEAVYAGAHGTRAVVIDFSLQPVRDADGAVVLLIAEGRDVSDQKAAQAELARTHDELRRAYDRAREADALKARFFANVSHELRTPLALVLGPVERLLADPRLEPDRRVELEVVGRNARTLLKHVNDLLDVSKLEAGRLRPRFARVDLGRLVTRTCSHFDGIARERGIRWRVEVPPACAAELDPDQIEHVLLNLLSNAFKFTPDGGAVRCELACEGEFARLEVADSGPGVPQAQREAIFERFHQLEGGTTRRFGGTGLGLAIARDLAQLHRGAVSVETAPEGGALFVLELPLAAPAGEDVSSQLALDEPSERARAEVAALQPFTAPEVEVADDGRPLVLVVEDHPEMNRFVCDALAPEYRTVSARDGLEGIARAEQLRPDLVVSDVMMPGTGGDRVVRALRSRPELEDVPIVLLTAKADDALRVRMLQDGAQDWIVKPFSAAELKARVANLVAFHRARALLRRELGVRSSDVERLAAEAARRKRDAERALEEARVARDHAERASRSKTEFLNMVSHELRTPLTGLLLQAARWRRDRDGHPSPRQLDAMGRIVAAAERLTHLVDSLLHHARAEAGRLVPQASHVDLPLVARTTVEELRAQAETKGLTLRLRTAPCPALRTDPRLVRIVLLNVVGNAVKFTDTGEVEVSIEPRGDGAAVRVRDTGPGIAAADRARIFEPFEQLEAVSAKHTPGVGLGLALVRELVSALGGRIDLDTEIGRGSTFTIVLPPVLPAPLRAGHHGHHAPAPAQQPTLFRE